MFDFADMVILFLLVVILVGGAGGLAYYISQKSCEALTANMGLAHRWSFFGDCQVEVRDGIWIPLDNYYYKEDVNR